MAAMKIPKYWSFWLYLHHYSYLVNKKRLHILAESEHYLSTVRGNIMSKTMLFLTWLFGLFMLSAGINHLIKPAFYNPFIPEWLPALAVNYVVGCFEAAIGLGLLFPKFRRAAAIANFLLMVFFLPFHVADVFRTNPAIGSHLLASIRLPIQFIFIYWAWFIIPKTK